MSKRARAIIIFASLSLLIFLAFGPALRTPFIWDDEDLILNNPLFSQATGFLKALAPSYWQQSAFPEDYRPFEMWSYMLDHEFWGKNPLGYHLTNLLLHAFNCAALSLLILLVFGSFRIAATTGILFALYPMHSEAVIWVQNRSELLSAAFALVSLISCVRYGIGRHPSVPLLTLSLISFTLSSLTKETALIVPLLCAALFLFSREIPRRRALRCLIPLFLIAFVILAMKFFLLSPESVKRAYPALTSGVISHSLTVIRTSASYLMMLSLPANFSIDRTFVRPDPNAPLPLLICAALIFILIAGTGAAFRRRNVAGLALSLTLISLLPVCNIFFIAGRPIAEQRIYFASMGFCLLLAAMTDTLLHTRARLATGLLLVLLLFCFTSSLTRTGYWRDEQTLWERTIEASPSSWKARFFLARKYRIEGRFDEALTLMKGILRSIYPRPPMFFTGLGRIYEAMGWDVCAVSAFEKTVASDPRSREARLLLGDAYRMQERLGDALGQYRFIEQTWPEEGKGQLRSAIVLREQKKYAEALKEIAAYLALFPRNTEGLVTTASIYEEMGDWPKAEQYLMEARERDPLSPMVLDNLGLYLEHRGRRAEARVQFEQAIRAAPQESAPHYHLSRIYLRSGEKAAALIELMRAAQRKPGRTEYLEEINRLSDDLSDEQIPPSLLDDILREHRALLNLRGIYCARIGDTRGALECFTKLVALSPGDGAAYANLGRIYLQQENYARALEQFAKAASLLPRESSIYSKMGICYYRLGRVSEARSAWSTALAIDPNLGEARRNIARMRR
ncbi:MAG: tetratricopeptide repeat protein [Candidatus Aureabacteria bacterium]|nr:tetratricopeptide repeat protein [Candidatus Auribacterota bacterium]